MIEIAEFMMEVDIDIENWRWGAAGERIRRLIKAKGLTQATVAEELGISQPYISSLLSGEKTNPDLSILVALRDLLGTSLDYLLLGIESEAGASVPSWLLHEIHERGQRGELINAGLLSLVIEESDSNENPVSMAEFCDLEGDLGKVAMRNFGSEIEELNTEEWRDLRRMITDFKEVLRLNRSRV